jgi:hypothetical protein
MKRQIHVWYDLAGKIVAWGYVPEGVPKRLGVIPMASPNHEIITAHVLVDDLPRLHETHYVDPNSKKLVLKQSI